MEDYFKSRKQYPDNIIPLIDQMNKLSDNMEFEKAKLMLNNIKEELKKSDSNYPFDIKTIKDIHELMIGHSIRLNPENYKFSDYLGLLINVHDRVKELQGKRYIDIDRQRQVIAEEMACLGITIPAERKGIKPNRRFLDIAHHVNPFIACKELERRERVKLWKAIESGKTEQIEKARKSFRQYSRSNI